MRADRLSARLVGLAVVAAATFAGATGQAFAKGPPPPPNVSAVDQYIEIVPTGGGGVAAGVGTSHSKALPRSIGTLLDRQGGADAPALRAIASSSAYGAPQQRLVRKQAPAARKKTAPASHTQRTAAPRSQSAISAAVSAGASDGGSHAVWLLGILVVTTLAALVMAALRQRARRL